MDYGSHTYPLQELDLTNSSGSTVSVLVYAFQVPNAFTILNSDYQIVAQSGWMGTANYTGPWGNELNAEDGIELTFPVTGNGTYYLQVETHTYSTADHWEAQVNCVSPTPEVNITSLNDQTATANLASIFNNLEVNMAQLSSELGLSYTLNASHIDFQNLSKSYISNDNDSGEAIVAPFISNSSNSNTNYAFVAHVNPSRTKWVKPMIIKSDHNQKFYPILEL